MNPDGRDFILTRLAIVERRQKEIGDMLDEIRCSIPHLNLQPDEKPEPKVKGIEPFLKAEQVCECLNIGRSTLWEWVRQGKLPPALTFSKKDKRWRMSDILAWQKGKQNQTTVNVIINNSQKRRGRPSKIRKKEEFS